LPDEDPDGDGQRLTLNLRFPGQYFDAETGLYYNYFRDYDLGTGRYIESDPVGLEGGLNTYGYSYQNPVLNIDPDGRFVWFVPPVYWAVGAASATAAVLINNSILGNIPDNIYVPGFPDLLIRGKIRTRKNAFLLIYYHQIDQKNVRKIIGVIATNVTCNVVTLFQKIYV
jgi:RHS repeat-associated protein